jgi:HEAT repeat protein
MSLFRFFMGVGTLRLDSPSDRQSRADKRKLENERKAWHTQAERVTPENADQFVPEKPLIETTDAEDIGEIARVTFSPTTKGGYAPFIAHRNPDGSFDKTPIPKPATFDLTEAFYVISAYYAGMPLKDLPGERVPLRLLSTGKWRFDIERMVEELEAAARDATDWELPPQASTSPPLESHIENVQNATDDLSETLAEARETVDYAILAMKSVATPEDAVEEYEKILAGVVAEDDEVRQHAYGALAGLAAEYSDRVGDDVGVLFAGLEDETAEVRKNALHALGNLAESRPDVVRPGRDAIRERIEDDDQTVAAYAMETLTLAEGSKPDVEDWMDRLEAALASPDDDFVLTAATRTAALLAESTPDSVEQLTDELEDYLDHEDADVREYACRYFQFMGPESVESALRERLEDSNPDVQRAARQALDAVAN